MKFHFRFEVLLKHRRRLEDIARRDHIEAQRELDDCLEGINQIYRSIETSREEIAQGQKVGDLNAIETIRASEHFIEGQKIRAQLQRQVARELMAKVEDRHEKLVEAVKEYRKIEKLKERMQQQFKKEQRRLEVKRVDDLVVMRFGMKRGSL